MLVGGVASRMISGANNAFDASPTATKFSSMGTSTSGGGQKFVPVGFNSYWLGLTEEYNCPPPSQIKEMFQLALKMKATVIRSHTLGISSGSQNALLQNRNKGNNLAWLPIDYAFYHAGITGVKLTCPLLDSYAWYNGSYGDFCDSKPDFFTDPTAIANFKTFISEWLQHTNSFTGTQIKNDPAVAFIELGNELGNYRADATSTAIPPESWIRDIMQYIKSIDSNHLVMDRTDECLGSSESNDFAVSELDCYSTHFYSIDYSRLNSVSQHAKSHGKPFVIGEYASTFDQSFFDAIDRSENVQGTIFWGMYPNANGIPGSTPVTHNDGYTLN
ncbi:UNVERIFIED_CONTAM: hypothetical protein HDU68_006694 [Siphonaria sp. JEL0065]|nr:hypothetical protein HDU68_006694 [Siphonaria sp. JEL0065]